MATVALARKILVILYTLLRLDQPFTQQQIKMESQFHSTARRFVNAISDTSIAPILHPLLEWLELPKIQRDDLRRLHVTLYEAILHHEEEYL